LRDFITGRFYDTNIYQLVVILLYLLY
jgi:hypothetical protein